LDIKPYLPYADKVPEANAGWATAEIPRYPVDFSPSALEQIASKNEERHPRLQALITQMLEWDPRPTSQRRAAPMDARENEGKRFAFRVLSVDVHWEIRGGRPFVIEVRELSR
jgi:hypothetical protein